MPRAVKNKVPRLPLPPREGVAQTYVTAGQASSTLGIKPASLYTYVSRGLIRSIVQPGNRTRLYYREDVERAGTRMGGRAGMPETVEAVLSWGQPVFHTSITDLSDGGPVYRGRPARLLAESGRSFESVAELLWSGIDMPQLAKWDAPEFPERFVQRLGAALQGAPGMSCLRIMSLATTLMSVNGHSRPDFERGSTIPDARVLITVYAAALGLLGKHGKFVSFGREGDSLASVFLRAVGVPAAAKQVRAVNAAMILCADHELSPSTLAARVAASCGSELRACLLAAIGTHSGTFLAGGCDRSEKLLRGAKSPDEMYLQMSRIERSGGRIPGYNLRAYPNGDPRARQLIALASPMGPAAERIATLVDGGYQKFFQTPSGKRKPALAEDLKTVHAFQEDLRESLGMTSLYNESLGTVSNRYLYDRVQDRDRGVPKRAWE